MYRLSLAIALLFVFSTYSAFAQHGPPPIDDPNEPGPPPPPAVCPTGDDRAINGIETFLESDLVADIRNEVGLEGASKSDFEPLTNADDGYICDLLNDDFDKRMQDDTWAVTYYKTPGHSPSQYVVVVGPAPSDPESNNVILGRTFIYVFDQSLYFINGFAH
ncbi:MAG: hypothetical protein GVY12_05040 [Bacteroidetes bacterium]|jgi:hypothetical protein|nr:hypothetical protein [Bacteroidota bacterium]